MNLKDGKVIIEKKL